MGLRRKGRECALQALYLSDITSLSPEKALHCISNTENLDKKANAFAKHLFEGVQAHKEALDTVIVKHTTNWELNRMAALDRNMLRLGAYELLYELDTPVSVIIDEAIEIVKIYSTDDSGKFVNGVLDKIKRERNGNGKS